VTAAEVADQQLSELHELITWCRSRESRTGYFAALYTHVAVALAAGLEHNAFEHPESLRKLNDVFFARYLSAFRAHRDGAPTTAAWRVAFDAAGHRGVCVLQHLLLGMNAHINLDLAIAVADAIPAEDLQAFRADFDRMNGLLASLVTGVAKDLAIVWPLLSSINRTFHDEDDVIINFSMRLAREQAWRGALRLSRQAGAGRAQAIAELDHEAAAIAKLVARPLWPGNLVAAVIRLGERGSVVQILDDLMGS
jgi:hypothetical protein